MVTAVVIDARTYREAVRELRATADALEKGEIKGVVTKDDAKTTFQVFPSDKFEDIAAILGVLS